MIILIMFQKYPVIGDTSTSKLHLSLEIFRWNYECTRLGGFLILIPFDRGVF